MGPTACLHVLPPSPVPKPLEHQPCHAFLCTPSSFEARRFASSENCLGDSNLCLHADVPVCSGHCPACRLQRQPGPHVSLGPALSSEAGNTPAPPGQSPRPRGWLQSLLFSPPWGSGAIGRDQLLGARKVGFRVGCLPCLEHWSGSIFKALTFCLSCSECGWCSRINTPASAHPTVLCFYAIANTRLLPVLSRGARLVILPGMA